MSDKKFEVKVQKQEAISSCFGLVNNEKMVFLAFRDPESLGISTIALSLENTQRLLSDLCILTKKDQEFRDASSPIKEMFPAFKKIMEQN